MSAITETDLAAVLSKMNAGEFITIFVAKADGSPGDVDEVVTYPTDGALDAATTVGVLGGFLSEAPVPPDLTENETGDGYLNADDEGNPLPMYSNLAWISKWVEGQVRGVVGRGLKKIAAAAISNPMP